MSGGSDADFAYCRQQAKEHDLDRYLCAALSTQECQPALFCISAFNIELGMISAQVTEAQIGQIRLQWWRDVLNDVFTGQPVEHPVARALANVTVAFDLPQHLFMRVIDGRERELMAQPFSTLGDLHEHCRLTSASMTELAARVLIGEDALALDDLVIFAGRAVGIANRIEQFKFYAAKGRCLLPAETMQKFDVTMASAAAVKSGKPQELLALFFVNEAMQAVSALRAEQSRLAKAVLPAFLPVSLSAQFLARVEKKPGFPLPEANGVSQLRKQMLLTKNAMLETL